MTVNETDALDLRRPTRAERVWLWRRRQPSPNGRTLGRNGNRMSANEAATLLGFTPEVYCAVERGDATAYEGAVLDRIRENYRDRLPAAGNLTPGELCALARKRAGTDVDTLRDALGGISRPTYFAWESAGAAALMAYWEARGYALR